ncbi:GON-4-like protein isoform X2 [Esox lucius]|uniref:GON-4-like protein isoform X2 n=1 Tax=Esox lucius TaxID=8010 RepID=UPI001476D994|nr:GON-4-like protein isoform X2 [Esox lucius]
MFCRWKSAKHSPVWYYTMSLVRKRKTSSQKGCPAKSVRGGKLECAGSPPFYSASSPLATESSTPTSQEEKGLEVHGTSSWRRSPRFKGQGLLGWVPNSELLVAEGSPGKAENERKAAQCCNQLSPQTDDDTEADLVITMDDHQGRGRKGSRKKGGAKRKKRSAEEQMGAGQQEGTLPEVEIDRELDRELENKSRQHNLTTTNVRNIIHEVITNEHVVAMMKAAMNETEAVPVFEPKMTRSKFKEVVEKGVIIPTWNISPIKKAQQFVDIQLAEEDSSDEEYCPNEEEDDETAEDTFQESDMESTASSPRGSKGAFPRGIHPEWDDDRSCSPMQVNRSRSRHLRVEAMPMGPPPPPKPSPGSQGSATGRAPPDCSFLEKLHAVEEELAIGPACLEPYQPPLADGLMACRTRSKRPLRDIPMGLLEAELRAPDITPDMYECGSAPEDREWTHWLQGIMTSDMDNDEEADDDDDDDPEYNFLAEIDEPDVEDYRNDRAVRITKKEVNQLMEELFETFQDDLPVLELEEEGQEEEEREEDAPALGTPTDKTPPAIQLEDTMEEEEEGDGLYRTVKEELAAIRRRRALLESQGRLPPRRDPKPKPPFTPTISHCQRLQLQQQIQQHVQLLTQFHMLTSPVASMQNEAVTTKQFLMELQMFAERGELSQCPLHPGFASVFRACNLQGALSLLEELRLSPIPYEAEPNEPRRSRNIRKYPAMPAELAWLFATRPMFLYPELLPLVSLDPALHSVRSASVFTPGEDCLLVLGLRNLQDTLQPRPLLCQYLLRPKRVTQITDHLFEMCKPIHPNNVIKDYQFHKVIRPMPLACGSVRPGDLRPPVERDERAMPEWLRRSLPLIYVAVKEHNLPPGVEDRATLLYYFTRTMSDYSFPAGTRYPSRLPINLSFQRCGFRRRYLRQPCDLSLSLEVSHSTVHTPGGETTSSDNDSHACAVIQQHMAHHTPVPVQPVTSTPPPPPAPPLQVILALPSVAVVCPVSSASLSPLSALQAKDLVAQQLSTLVNLRRLPRLPTAPPQTTSTTGLNAVAPGLSCASAGTVTPTSVVEEKELLREENEDRGEEQDLDVGDIGMPVLALSESSASPWGSVDPTEWSDERQETTASLSPRPSDAGDEEGDEERGDVEVGHVRSPASEESTLSVPELQETMENVSWVASGERSDVLEQGEQLGTSPGCCSSTLTPSSSRHEQHPIGETCSEGMPKSPLILHDHDDLLDHDPLKEKEMAFAQDYLNRVCNALQEVPGRVQEFLKVFYEFERDRDKRSSVGLFMRLKPVLSEWPELLRDFAAFLHSEQAQECGLLPEQQAFERSRRFLRQLELSFGENSSHYQKIVSILQGGSTVSPDSIRQIKAQIATLLQGHTHLQGEFWVFFNELHPQPPPQCQTKTRGCGVVSKTNSTSQKSSAASKPKRLTGPGTPKAKPLRSDEREEDKEDCPRVTERPVCAKNISLTPSGEKVILWTREADRAILTACKLKGANKCTFQEVSAQLGNKTTEEVCVRFQELVRLFRSSMQQACSDKDVSDSVQPTSSREPDPD